MQQVSDVYLVFAAAIDQLAVQRIFAMTTTAIQTGAQRVHLLMQSGGGHVQDGVCLYNYFRAFPAELIVYNVGSISSAGVLAYLGAHHRKAAPLATFMVHRAHATFQGANADMVQARIQSMVMDDDRMEAILKAHLRLPDEKWLIHEHHDLWLTAEEAVQCGLATEIGDFAPPAGSVVYNVFG
jgi:ATP-dependent Clp protease, protease subunit